MENLFRPGKWLVLFCGVFILLWAVLQYVSTSRLKEEAQLVGNSIFTWYWPGDNWQSKAHITDMAIIQRTDRDAVVQVKGTQTLLSYPSGSIKVAAPGGQQIAMLPNADHTETVDCAATLTFYRMSEHNKDFWVLGKVEFP